jgi:hypothetical protein
MAVKVDYGHGTVSTVDRLQQRKGDGVVAAEGDDTGQGLAALGRSFLVRVGGGSAREDVVVSLLDLVESEGVVVPRVAGSAALEPGIGTSRGTYEVTGMSPQSRTLAQLLNGFVSSGTLYPPLPSSRSVSPLLAVWSWHERRRTN